MQSEHTSPQATDGDIATYWVPEPTDPSPVLRLDMERCVYIHRVHLVFPEQQPYHYVVEGSLDGESWFVLHDMKANATAIDKQDIGIQDSHILTRFIRLRFFDVKECKAGLAEISAEVTEQ